MRFCSLCLKRASLVAIHGPWRDGKLILLAEYLHWIPLHAEDSSYLEC